MITTTLCTSTQTVKVSTASETSTHITSWTAIPVQTIIPHVQFPSPTSSGRPGDGVQDLFTIVMIAASVAVIALIIIITVVISCVIVRSVHIHV